MNIKIEYLKPGMSFRFYDKPLTQEDIDSLKKEKLKTVDIELGSTPAKNMKGEIVTAQKMNDYNDFGKAEKITLKPFNSGVQKSSKGTLKIEMPAMSVVKLQFSNNKL